MKSTFVKYWRELANGNRSSIVDNLLILCLAPISVCYAYIQKMRAYLYLIKIIKTQHLPRPVVSIGNLTVGGTGKTPVTSYIANFLINNNYKVAVLSRGYGGLLEGKTVVVSNGNQIFLNPEECGDEPYLLASSIPGLIVIIGTDRYAAGQLAMQLFEPDIFLLDDGFQHLRLYRDFNILLLDSKNPFGNGWTLPAGLLRESTTASKRADIIILTRSPEGSTLSSAMVSNKPAFAASHCLLDAIQLLGNNSFKFTELSNHKFLAFAGIAEPEFFFAALREKNINLVQTISFPDHTEYNQNHILQIQDEFMRSNSTHLITTEKDGVKLKLFPPDLAAVTYKARLSLKIENSSSLLSLVRNLLP